MRRLIWRTEALRDLDNLHAWLSTLDNAQPDRTIMQIRASADSLARLGDIGRPSRVQGLRELSVRNAPYVLAYRFSPEEIDILAVYHTAKPR
jgi:plasmid stabilization system protein ParE